MAARSDARKRREADRTTWGTEHEDLEVLRAELAACRAEITRLRAQLAHPARIRRVPRGSGLALGYSPIQPHRHPSAHRPRAT